MASDEMMNWSVEGGDIRHPEASGAPVGINVSCMEALLGAIGRKLAQGAGFTVATLNLDHVVKLRLNPAFRAAYARHTFVVADGNPIVWLSRLAGEEVALVPGSDLVEPLLALAARQDVPVAFFGSTEAALSQAADRLTARHPDLRVVARISPPMGFDPTGPEAQEAIDRIAASGAGLCLLALGAPKQEIFAAHAAERLSGIGFVSVGAGLDFWAGTQRRAPAWARAMAVEWLWRLLSDPARLAQRYAACFAVLPGLTVKALQARRSLGRTGSRA